PSVVSWIRDATRDAISSIKNFARAGPRCPTKYETISFVSASMAVHVHTSPQPAATCSSLAVFIFAPTKLQISSHWSRRTRTLRTYSPWNAAQARPASSKSRRTVCLPTPSIRHVALMEFPSTKAAITCARRVVLSWFIAVSCLYNSSITANVKLYIASKESFYSPNLSLCSARIPIVPTRRQRSAMVVIMQYLATAPSALPSDASALEASISALRNSIAVLDNSIKTLEGSSTGWEVFAWSCSFLVAVGVAAEIVAVVWGYREELEDWSRGIIRPPDRPSVRKLWFDVVATLLVVIGVFGEAGASAELASKNSQLRSKTSELRSKSDQLLALVTQEA